MNRLQQVDFLGKKAKTHYQSLRQTQNVKNSAIQTINLFQQPTRLIVSPQILNLIRQRSDGITLIKLPKTSKYDHISKIQFHKNYHSLNSSQKRQIRQLYKESEREWKAESEVS